MMTTLLISNCHVFDFSKQKSCACQPGLLPGLFVMITHHPISCTRVAHAHCTCRHVQGKILHIAGFSTCHISSKENDMPLDNNAKAVQQPIASDVT